MLVRLLIYIVVGVVLYRTVRSWLRTTESRSRPGRSHAPGQVDDVMIKDPVCGAFFPQRNAVALNSEGQALYFCSPECRDRYLAEKT